MLSESAALQLPVAWFPGRTNTSQTPGPSRAAHLQGGCPPKEGRGRDGRLSQGLPYTAQSLPSLWLA